ncbi:MAG: lysophospholipase [Propionibacteriaceae bacterium]|nr:lysophospholipase [Propionibacteriaceae bacterium]
MKTTTETICMADGQLIQLARFVPDVEPVAVIQFVHGFGEHIGMYKNLGQYFADNGIAFVIHDQRGHGEMPDKTVEDRKRAWGVARYVNLLTDITEIRRRIADWYPGLPVTLAGLSMGGNIVANYAERIGQRPYANLVIESPWLRLAKPMPEPVTAFARAAGQVFPNFTISSRLKIDAVSRDVAETTRMTLDKLYHDRISFKLYSQVLDAGEYAIAHASEIELPTLLLDGTGDQIVSVQAIREFAANAGPNLVFKEFDGGYHALHQDIVKDEVLATILEFCLPVVAPPVEEEWVEEMPQEDTLAFQILAMDDDGSQLPPDRYTNTIADK